MSYSPPPERKEECIAHIRKKLAELKEGEKLDRAAICAAFPEINKASIWNWCRRLVEGMPSKRELNATYKAIEEAIENKSPVVDQLPAIPPPAMLAKNDGAPLRQLDFAVEIRKLYSDAEMLRAYAVRVARGEGGEDTESIKNPVAFEKSIRSRAGLIETSLKVLSELWDMRAMQQFNELIIEQIGLESPECQQRIIERLAVLNRRHGMNFNGLRV